MHVEPQTLVGTWRRFGVCGPVYEIVDEGNELPEGDKEMKIRIVETGEELEYKLSKIMDDPKEL